MIDDFDSNHPTSPRQGLPISLTLHLAKTSMGAPRRLAFLAYSQRDMEVEKEDEKGLDVNQSSRAKPSNRLKTCIYSIIRDVDR